MSKIIEIIDSDEDAHTPTLTSNTSSMNNMEQDDNQQAQSRRRRRKSVLHVMNDPDMQFQTISLDDDDDVATNDASYVNSVQKQKANQLTSTPPGPRTSLKTQKVTPKILSPKVSTNDEIGNVHFEKFLNDPETTNDIYAIAEERSRINYLLAVNGMPEIDFDLYTRTERLQLQFEDRLKQRIMLNNLDSTRLLENRRSLLQNNE